MNIVAIIPARMDSTRFPGKPLKLINNIPMVGHCYQRALMCKELSAVYVATCDLDIKNYINSINGSVIMTSKKHNRASTRVSEAMLKIERITNKKIDIVVMIQGDEPMITPGMISSSLAPFKDKEVNIVNLISEFDNLNQFNSPDEIKVIKDKNNNAVYFSRSPIPYNSSNIKKPNLYKQVCIIPFRRKYLLKFNAMKETFLERMESVDMLRVIENGDKVKLIKSKAKTYSVDTLKDLRYVSKKMKGDKLSLKYIKSKLN